MLSIALLAVTVVIALRIAPRERADHTAVHGAGQIGLLAAVALFGVDYFTSYYYAAGEMLSALHPYGLLRYAYLTAGVISLGNLVFGGLYMYSLGIFNEGGGSYTASMRYLWPTLSLVVAVTLLQDYVFTIVVSALAGVDQLLSVLNAYGAHWLLHFGLGALMCAATWYITIRGRGDSARVTFAMLSVFAMLTATMFAGLIIANLRGLAAIPTAEAPQQVSSLGQALMHMLTATMKGMVALTGLEAVSNGIQFMIDEDVSLIRWGKQHLPRLNGLWRFYSGKSGIARFVQTSFLFYGGLTTYALTFFAIRFNVFDGTLGRTLVANLSYIGFTQLSGGTVLFWAYQFLAVGLLTAASMTAFQDVQATGWRDSAIGEIPEIIAYRDRHGTFTRSVTITFGVAVLLMFLVHGETSLAIPYYGIGVFMPITVMGLACRQHIKTHATGKRRAWGVFATTAAAIMAAVVFVGQIAGKWQEGGWVVLISFSVLAIVAHLVLLSPAGHRHPDQIERIVRHKARIQGGMATIVEWQSFRMQEYRYRLLVSLSGFLELLGVGQAYRPVPVPAVTGVAGGGRASPFLSAPARLASLPWTRRSSTRGLAAERQPGNSHVRTSAVAQPAPYAMPSHIMRHRLIVPIDGIHQGTLTALAYARSLSDDITAVHVVEEARIAARLQQEWDRQGEGVRLVLLDSPHGMVLEPLLQYIQRIVAERQPREAITLVVPQLVQPRWWRMLWKSQMATLLRMSLPVETGIVIIDVPYEIR